MSRRRIPVAMKSDKVKATPSVAMDQPQAPFGEFVARGAAKWSELTRRSGITFE